MSESTIKVVGICSLIIYLSVYFFFNRRITEAKLLHTWADDYIPFIAWSVFPYLFFYTPLLYGSIFVSYFQSLHEFYEFLLSYIVLLTAIFFVFIMYPTRVKEHEVVGTSIWHKLMRLVYTYDRRVGAFPSIHVAVSIVSSYYLSLWFPHLSTMYAVIAGSIIISTVTTKQHSVLDIIGGSLVGISAIFLGASLGA